MKVANPLKKRNNELQLSHLETGKFANSLKKKGGLNYSFEHPFFDPIEYI